MALTFMTLKAPYIKLFFLNGWIVGTAILALGVILSGCSTSKPVVKPKPPTVPTSIIPPGLHGPIVTTALGKTFAASQVVQLPDTNTYIYSGNIVGWNTNVLGQKQIVNISLPDHLIESNLQPDWGHCVIRYVDNTQYAYRVTVEYKPYAGYDGSNHHYILWGSPDLTDWIELDCTDSTCAHVELFDHSDHSTIPTEYFQVTIYER